MNFSVEKYRDIQKACLVILFLTLTWVGLVMVFTGFFYSLDVCDQPLQTVNRLTGTFFLSNVLMIPVFYIKPELYDSTPVLLVTSFMSLATLVSTVTLNVFFFMVKTCDKTATTKTFLGTLYESTQQNVIQLDVLIAFAVIVYIYLEYKKSEPTVEKNYSDPFAPNSVY